MGDGVNHDNQEDEEANDIEDENEGGGGIVVKGKKTIVPKTTVWFQIKAEDVEIVKCHAIDFDCLLMEEYDFRNDTTNPDVPMDLKPNVGTLSKMFGNGHA